MIKKLKLYTLAASMATEAFMFRSIFCEMIILETRALLPASRLILTMPGCMSAVNPMEVKGAVPMALLQSQVG